MNVIYNRRSGSDDAVDYAKFVEGDTLLKESDFISLHVPAQKDPNYLISKAEIEQMKDGVYLINTARGGLIVEDDLVDALDSGKVAGAALDVFSEEPTKNTRITSHPLISMTPHIGAATGEAQKRIGSEIVEIVTYFFKDKQ